MSIINYNHKKRSADKNKKYVNSVLGLMAKGKLSKGNALILDSPALLTTKTLLKAGFKKNKIFIPNPVDYDGIDKKEPALVYDLWLNDFIKHKKCPKKISFAFLDFCSSLDGNEYCKPIKDIELLFKKGYLINDGLLAVTISFRNKNHKHIGTYNDSDRLDEIVTHSAFSNDYVALSMGKGHAYNGMFFKVYKIKKIRNKKQTVNQNETFIKTSTNIKIRRETTTKHKIKELISKGYCPSQIGQKLKLTKKEYYKNI